MSTLDNQLYIDAVVVKGVGRTFSMGIKQVTEESANEDRAQFEALDLSPYSVRFKVLGSATGDGEVLINKLITQTSNPDEEGIIEEPSSGEFTFTITAEDTNVLGLGSFPIMIQLVDMDSLNVIYTLTEGGIAQGEFNRIQIVKV